MKSRKSIRNLSLLTLTVSLLSQSMPAAAVYGTAPDVGQTDAGGGRWMAGEYHVHTYESDDAQRSLQTVLDNAFEQYGMDWIALADHLRMSGRDDEGNPVPGGPIPFSKGMALYQVPKIKQLQDANKYKDKIIFSGFEWDMPTYDHIGIGILADSPDQSLKAASEFEYLFTNRDESLFDPADVAVWKATYSRAYTTSQDARTGLSWIKGNFPKNSYALLNHPSRKTNSGGTVYKISDIRDFNNIAPETFFGMEGMPGNQMEPDRGGLNLTTPKNRTYGGADYMIAKVGGVWDALLGEGRRFWNFSNSDYHFDISDDNKYSSGYKPGEYSKNYTWVNGSDMQAVLEGMRSGKSFSVFGDLINALDYHIDANGTRKEMGEELSVKEGDPLMLTIRFKSPDKNNNGDPVQVDHVDLIAGDVTGYAAPGTPEYAKDTNDSTQVLQRFTSSDWTQDAEGYNVITYNLGAAGKNQYFRLRGTNLGTDVAGETSNGEPLIDPKTDIADNATRFAEINKRNYSDLWFYSNPIFVNVEPYSDQQAVNDTVAALDLGDMSGVTADIELPAQGQHGAAVQWESMNPSVVAIANNKGIVTRPAAGQPDAKVTLKATVSRGTTSEVKTFEVTVKALAYTDAQAVALAKNALTLGDTSSVENDLKLPAAGAQGTVITWKSSNPVYMDDNGKMVFHPDKDTDLTLTATIKRGNAVDVKIFSVTLKGDASITPLQLSWTMKTSDGNPYASGAWTNQNVTASVYANVYVPGSTVSLELSTDGGAYLAYNSQSKVEVTSEGEHTLQFRAKDSLGHTAELPLAVSIDRTAPVITLKGSPSIIMLVGTPYNEQGAEAADHVGIAGEIAITGTVDTKTIGTYTLHYNATDLAGNAAAEVTRTVNVVAPQGNSNHHGSGGGSSTPTNTSNNSTNGNNTNQGTEASSSQVAVTTAQGAEGGIKDVLQFKIPSGAVKEDGKIQAVLLPSAQIPSFGSLKAVSQAVELTSTTGRTFTKPVEIKMFYKADSIAPGSKPAVYYYNETQKRWIYLGGTVNPDGSITVNVKHFTKFAVLEYKPAVFPDLSGHWAAPYTERLTGMNVIQGFEDGKFRPEQTVTRAQFAKMIAEAMGLQATAASTSFADDNQIPSWAKGSIAAAVQAGLINGYEENGRLLFKADQTITRAEMAVMMSRALSANGYKGGEANAISFKDASHIPDWAQASVKASAVSGILNGYEDQTFRPSAGATRAESSAMIYKLLEALNI
ncbi:immunoglobulin-like domain-containing protein [Paenibacillus sp. OAS669]|uniref:immunoglobulin-like domain-containing protein n=1 Tax=Paenibacillus sp. OAS669 TaxID=2663821 RepID=UPI00178A6834|nr:immunoglobulin-like domain-containing protein [Paenibacillus sp. OAS669]MBE1446496.1 hypothetical protein [Paenibacillus sp. OAS669]